MEKTIPAAKGDTLVWRDGKTERLITVGTPAWFEWLVTASRFSFAGSHGRFLARKERFQRGGCYWKAYCRREGKLRLAYLGKTEALTKERLNEVAGSLAEHGDGDRSPLPEITGANYLWLLPEESSGEAEPQDPLLLTKLSLPPLRSDLVARPHLIRRLDGIVGHGLTLVSAPAGFGKTTLLNQWSLKCKCPTAWLCLEATDSDLVRFWFYFVSALQTLCPSIGTHALSVLRSPKPAPMELFLTVLINEIATEEGDFAVVLDDYHVVESLTIHSTMTYLLDHLPQRMHLVISSRADPPIPLARLRARRQLMELRAADLSFNLGEATLFLREIMGLGLSAEHVAALEKSTEGWIAGLQLAAMSLQECENIPSFIKAFAGSHRYILDYLVEEVLSHQPESVQSFLLQTSILDRLTGPLCEAVTGQANCQRMLERLERDNLFTVALDNERRWYRYHRLFAGFLRARLHEAQSERMPELHRRACAWYANHGLAAEGMNHALAAREFELAAGLVKQAAPLLQQRNERITAIDSMWALPDAAVSQSTKGTSQRKPRANVEHLSERELDVLRLITSGASNRDIALELVVAESTVKKHINNIYSKLGIRSRTQAIARARLLGFVL